MLIFYIDMNDIKITLNQHEDEEVTETKLIDIALGNRFNWLAKEQEFIGQYSEEYLINSSLV